MSGKCGTHENKGKYKKASVEKPEEKKSVGRPGCRWEDDFKTVLKDMGCDDMDCFRVGSSDTIF
jgi:hypothetical protein